MGVPTFYRYVHDRWPRCISDYVERPAESAEWDRLPNPNDIEFDALYLDFNGIVHNATHPQDRPAPPNRQAMMMEIFRLVDRIVAAARPRRLLYIAVDGVAPRAKMDQQRARRFLAALERRGSAAKAVRDGGGDAPGTDGVDAAGESGHVGDDGAGRGAFDHNAITPGSAFMAELGACLRYYCAARTGSCSSWQGLCVVLSDSTVAGEGEHKIMDFIRQRRLQPGYDPDSSHCVYGLDADLVMLGLATHELSFHILREWVPIGAERFRLTCDVCGRDGHSRETCAVYCAAQASCDAAQERAPHEADPVPDKRLEVLDVSLVREYILYALRPDAFMPGEPRIRGPPARHGASPPAAAQSSGKGDVAGRVALHAIPAAAPTAPWWDAERVLDDFVFLTFLVGNDFLPPLPHLAIRSGGLDVVLDVYRQARVSLGGYLLCEGGLQLRPLARFFAALAAEEVFTIRRRDALRAEKTAHRKRKPAGGGGGALGDLALPESIPGACTAGQVVRDNGHTAGASAGETGHGPVIDASPGLPALPPMGQATGSWRAGEYAARFGNDFDRAKLHRLCLAHVRGLAWCAHYYFHGCPDWRWHFGHHYAPYAADLAQVAAGLVEQDERSTSAHAPGGVAEAAAPHMHGSLAAGVVIGGWGEDGPLHPLQQLAAVLPPDSAALLPDSYQQLICSETSALAAYFPPDVPLDARGCRHAWQAVPLLPFVPLDLLLRELEGLPLRCEEERRNAAGLERVYAHPEVARRMCPRLQLVSPASGKGEDMLAGPKWEVLSSSAPIFGRARLKGHKSSKASLITAPLGLELPALDPASSVCLEMRAPARRPHVAALLHGATPHGPRLTLIELSAATRGKVTAHAVAGAGAAAPAVKCKKSTATAVEKALAHMGATAASTANPTVQPGSMFGFIF
mmetsp:Transcript_30240/g.96506  ORF Transcript_30240/g.96506 Transcript_30240/m.96506 type:complete len:913 (+) Transcript_30240:32-2770(+)